MHEHMHVTWHVEYISGFWHCNRDEIHFRIFSNYAYFRIVFYMNKARYTRRHRQMRGFRSSSVQMCVIGDDDDDGKGHEKNTHTH